ncbi:MAG: zinc dependent phospholipase C family protein [Gemmatimonadota bacterium]|nr:zinc dependent phospholipase C family protein [Gemmatimonadota bacterium]
MYLGSGILSSLAALPVVVRELLRRHPYEYLYGSISADITLAKRYVHYSRHGHNWNVAWEIVDRAETAPLQSFALGYMSHLAADTVAHNVFVPRMLASTPLTSNLGHTYWEYRYDAALDDRFLRLAREIVTMDHTAPDELLEDVLTQAFFSFRTNKTVFRQLIHLSNDERWHNLWVRMADKSRWELPDEEVERYDALTRDTVEDFLVRGAHSLCQRHDPTGNEALALAKKLRRRSFRSARREAGRELAQAPIAAALSGETGRLVSARPVPRSELETVAEVYFPEPSPPSFRNGADSRRPPWFEERDERSFWEAFTDGRALPAGAASAGEATGGA